MITLDSIEYQNSSIQIKDAAGDALAIGADGSINITDNGGSLTVDGTVELGATTLAALETIELGATTLAALESITVQNGSGGSAVNIQDGGNSITVDGSVSVSALPGSLQGYADGIAWTAGNFGAEALAVRKDANGAFTGVADGDYSPLQLSANGLLKIGVFDSAGDQLAINADGSFNAQFTESGYASWLVSNETVDTTAGGVQLVATALTGRLRIEIQNLGTQDIYIAEATGVTTSSGLKIPKGSSYEQALDAGAEIWAITGSGSSDVRVAEYAA